MFRSRIRRRNEFRQVTRTARRWPRLRLDRLEDRTAPATIAWDGGATGQGTNWLDPVNWAGDVQPGLNDDAVIGPAAPGQPAEITLTGNAAVHSATLTGRTLRLLNASFTGSMVNLGTVLALGTDTISGALTTHAGSTIRLLSDGMYMGADLTVASFTNNGAIELISNSDAYESRLLVGSPDLPNGTLTNASGGTITASTNSRVATVAAIYGAAFDNRGTVTVGPLGPFPQLLVQMSDSSSNSGTVDVRNGNFLFNSLDNYGAQVPPFVNSGAVIVGDRGRFQCRNYRHRSGSLAGTGVVALDGAAFETNYSVGVYGYFEVSGDIDGPGTLTIPRARGLKFIGGTINAPLVIQGTFVCSGTVNGPLANTGTISVQYNMTWNSPGAATNSGTIEVYGNPGLTLNLQGPDASFTTTGGIFVAEFGAFAVNGNYVQSGGTTTVDGTLEINGNFSQPGGSLSAMAHYHQLKVAGTVALGGQLVGNLNWVVGPGDTIHIIDNDGTDPVIGTFAGLPEGARVTILSKDGLSNQVFTISYFGGTGNDVVLTPAAPATVVWDGGPTGRGTDWSDPANWAGDFLPAAKDDVIIGPVGGLPPLVTLTTDTAVHNVTLVGGTLRVVSAKLNLTNLTNAGTIELTGPLNGHVTNAVGGTIATLASGASLSANASLDNQGTINIGGPTYGGAWVNSGTIDVAGGDLGLGSTLTTTGTVTVAAGRRLLINGGYAQSAGTTTINGVMELVGQPPNAANIFVQTGGTTTVSGTLRAHLGLQLSGGTLAGTGTVDAKIAQYGGTINPGGLAAGTLISTYQLTQIDGALVVDLNGPTAGTQYDQLESSGPLRLGGTLVVNVGFAAAIGDTFRIIDNLGTGAVTGTFAGLPDGAVLTVGGQNFRISYAGGDGNDVTLTRAGPVVPKVDSVRVNDGAAQRSRVSNLTVSFNTEVTFAGPAVNAFVLSRDSDAAPVVFTATTSVTGGVTFVTLSQFAGAATEAGSVADGRYTLTVRASQVSTAAGPLDGNHDGTPGDDYIFAGLHRLYGDMSGDGWVDAPDLTQFRQTFGSIAGDPQYLSGLDVNGDGAINGTELTRFRQAYFATPPRVSAVQVNDGSAQRSRITSLTVTFSTSVSFAGPPAAAFVLTREDGTLVTFAATVTVAGDAMRVTLDRFAGAAVEAGSLADGQYTLKVLASQVSAPAGALDGNEDGTPGGDYSFGAAQGLVRKYGDGNGDGKVDAADLTLFRQTFGRVAGDPLYQSGFDVNGDGAINGTELTRFRQAFGGGG